METLPPVLAFSFYLALLQRERMFYMDRRLAFMLGVVVGIWWYRHDLFVAEVYQWRATVDQQIDKMVRSILHRW